MTFAASQLQGFNACLSPGAAPGSVGKGSAGQPGQIWIWGTNNLYQLGQGNTTGRSSPILLNSDSDWVQVCTGNEFCLALKADGRMFGWGGNTSGQLCTGNTNSVTSPIQIGSDYTWRDIVACGDYFWLAMRSDNVLFAAGNNSHYQLGDGTNITRSSMVQVSSSGVFWNWLDVGASHCIGVKSDSSLYTWGANTYYQEGNGTNIDVSIPTQVSSNQWLMGSAGANANLFLDINGNIYASGQNTNYQYGNGTNVSASVPTLCNSSIKFSMISYGYSFNSYGIGYDGKCYSWGSNASGCLGQNSATPNYSIPTQIGATSDFLYVCAGTNNALFLKQNGNLMAVGLNTSGQLGDGSKTTRSSPVLIGSATSWLTCCCYSNFSAGIRAV